MIIYDNVKKNIKITIYSKHKNILNNIVEEVEKEGFKTEQFDNIDKLLTELEKGKIKILIYLFDDKEELEHLYKFKEYTKLIFFNNQNINIEALMTEIVYTIKIIEGEQKIDFEKYKLEIVGNLVESISHKIQANLLVLGASQDVIKLLSNDLKDDMQKKEILDSLYGKNTTALDNSNMLLQLISNVTSLSNESIMHCSEIRQIILEILDEYLKNNDINLIIEEKIKVGSYICGPLNDVIFVICRLIKLLIDEKQNEIKLIIYEDESNWYFTIDMKEKISDKQFVEKIRRFIVYIKNVRPKIGEKQISLIIKKIR